MTRIFRETVGQHASGGTGANDDVIRLYGHRIGTVVGEGKGTLKKPKEKNLPNPSQVNWSSKGSSTRGRGKNI